MSTTTAAWLAAVRDGVARALPTSGAFARHVSIHATTSSTNDDVARAAGEGAPEGWTSVAAAQTAGRGRRGATWHSPDAHGLYLSTLLRPEAWPAVRTDAASPVTSLVTLMAGVAVVSALGDIGATGVELKWPNDVMVRSAPYGGQGLQPLAWRKLAGILAEGAGDGAALRTIVVGIGINVVSTSAPPDVAARMIALDGVVPSPRDGVALVSPLVTALLTRLSEGVRRLADGRAAEIRAQWRDMAPSVDGTPVRWHAHGVTREGRAAGIDERGALRVRCIDGEHVVHGGEVEWLLETADA